MVTPFDRFGNPTTHATDSFAVNIGDETKPNPMPGNKYSGAVGVAGNTILRVFHVPTNTAIESAIFVVLPAAPSGPSSSHNVDFESVLSRKTVDVPLQLRVDPFDRYNNSLSTATGYAVSINGAARQNLTAPSFSYTYAIPAGYSDPLRLSFTLDGEDIANSPITIAVAPDMTIVIVGAVAGFMLLVALAAFCFEKKNTSKKRKLERIELEKELELSMDEKLMKDYTAKIQKQQAMFAYEIIDMGSDMVKPVYMAVTLQAGREWLLAACGMVALLAVAQAFIAIPVRRRVLKHLTGIIQGDVLHVYAEALHEKETGVKVSAGTLVRSLASD